MKKHNTQMRQHRRGKMMYLKDEESIETSDDDEQETMGALTQERLLIKKKTKQETMATRTRNSRPRGWAGSR